MLYFKSLEFIWKPPEHMLQCYSRVQKLFPKQASDEKYHDSLRYHTAHSCEISMLNEL